MQIKYSLQWNIENQNKKKKKTSIKSYKPTWFNSKLGSNPCKHLLNLILTQVWVHVKVVPNNGFDLGLGGSISV
jgi:hypothetical protein